MEESNQEEVSLSMACTNCYQPFDLDTCTPYALQYCNHTACKQCLRVAHKTKSAFICAQDDILVPLQVIKTLSKNLDVIKILREREISEMKALETKQQEQQNIEEQHVSIDVSKGQLPSKQNNLLNTVDSQMQPTRSSQDSEQMDPKKVAASYFPNEKQSKQQYKPPSMNGRNALAQARESMARENSHIEEIESPMMVTRHNNEVDNQDQQEMMIEVTLVSPSGGSKSGKKKKKKTKKKKGGSNTNRSAIRDGQSSYDGDSIADRSAMSHSFRGAAEAAQTTIMQEIIKEAEESHHRSHSVDANDQSIMNKLTQKQIDHEYFQDDFGRLHSRAMNEAEEELLIGGTEDEAKSSKKLTPKQSSPDMTSGVFYDLPSGLKVNQVEVPKRKSPLRDKPTEDQEIVQRKSVSPIPSFLDKKVAPQETLHQQSQPQSSQWDAKHMEMRKSLDHKQISNQQASPRLSLTRPSTTQQQAPLPKFLGANKEAVSEAANKSRNVIAQEKLPRTVQAQIEKAHVLTQDEPNQRKSVMVEQQKLYLVERPPKVEDKERIPEQRINHQKPNIEQISDQQTVEPKPVTSQIMHQSSNSPKQKFTDLQNPQVFDTPQLAKVEHQQSISESINITMPALIIEHQDLPLIQQQLSSRSRNNASLIPRMSQTIQEEEKKQYSHHHSMQEQQVMEHPKQVMGTLVMSQRNDMHADELMGEYAPSINQRYEESNPPSRSGSAQKNPEQLNTQRNAPIINATLPPRHPVPQANFYNTSTSPTSQQTKQPLKLIQEQQPSYHLTHPQPLPSHLAHLTQQQQQLLLKPLPQPLSESCTTHPRERVKYYCRSQDCMLGLCPECVLEHSRHDLVAASDLASMEIKQIVRQAQRTCKKQAKQLKQARTITEEKLTHLNTKRDDEFSQLNKLFSGLRKMLEDRELQMQKQFNEQVHEVELRLTQDVNVIHNHHMEYVGLFKDLKTLAERFAISSDIGIVSHARQAWHLHLQTQEYMQSFKGDQLYILEIQKAQQQLDIYDMDDNDDPFRDLKIPKFQLDFELEKQKVSNIGGTLIQYGKQQTFKNETLPYIPQQQQYVQDEQPQYHSIPYQQQQQYEQQQPAIIFKNEHGENMGIQVKTDEDNEHITIRIVKNPQVSQDQPAYDNYAQQYDYNQNYYYPPEDYQQQQYSQQNYPYQNNQNNQMMSQQQQQQFRQANINNYNAMQPIQEESEENINTPKQSNRLVEVTNCGIQCELPIIYPPLQKKELSQSIMKNRKVQTKKKHTTDIFTQAEQSDSRAITTQTAIVPGQHPTPTSSCTLITIPLFEMIHTSRLPPIEKKKQLLAFDYQTQTSLPKILDYQSQTTKKDPIETQEFSLQTVSAEEDVEYHTVSIQTVSEYSPYFGGIRQMQSIEVQTVELVVFGPQQKQGEARTIGVQTLRRKLNVNTYDLWECMPEPKKAQITESVQTIVSPLPPLVHKQSMSQQLNSNSLRKRSSSVVVNSPRDSVISNHYLPQQISSQYWFRWDTSEVYRLDPNHSWKLRSDLKVSHKFLFFSAILHLPKDQGCFIMGGSDNEDNYSKRVQYFCKYNVFIEKPQMINKRAFFCSVFTQLDNAIYVFGGSDSNQTDLGECEKFSLAESVWRPIQSMKSPKNGASALSFEGGRLIFIFGGNSHSVGSLQTIEKYEIDFDKWSVIDLTLRKGLHDMQAVQVSRDRVLIFGGHTDGEGPNRDIIPLDLSVELYKSRFSASGSTLLLKEEAGKSYFLPSMSKEGKIQLIFGYCDQKPRVTEVDMSEYLGYIGVLSKQQEIQQEDTARVPLHNNQQQRVSYQSYSSGSIMQQQQIPWQIEVNSPKDTLIDSKHVQKGSNRSRSQASVMIERRVARNKSSLPPVSSKNYDSSGL